MKSQHSAPVHACGASLIEGVIAMGVLAVALPLVFAVIARSAQATTAAQAESRSTWIIPACLEEIQAAAAGKAQFLTNPTPNQPFPTPNKPLALAFSPDGRTLGSIQPDAYAAGIRQLAGQAARYIVSIHTDPAQSAERPMRGLRLTLEYPAAVPHTKRRKLDFHTHLP
jgi:Tfp pilus assembly protein PilV